MSEEILNACIFSIVATYINKINLQESSNKIFHTKGKSNLKKYMNKSIWFKVIITILFCIIMAITNMNLGKIQQNIVESPVPIGEITKGKLVTQEINVNRKINSIYIQFGTYTRANTSNYTIDIKKNDLIVFSKTINSSILADNEFYEIKLDNELDSENCLLEIYSDDATEGNAVTLYAGKAKDNMNNTLKINNQKLNSSIKFNYSYNSNIILYIVIMSIIAIMTAIIFSYKNFKIEKLVLGLILFYGILFSLFNPIIDSPDEYPHFYKAVATSDFKLLKYDSYEYDISDSYFDVVQNRDNTIFNNSLWENLSNNKSRLKKTDIVGMAVYAPWGYIPQAIAIKVGKIMNLDMAITFYLGRIFNLILYAFLSYYAIKIIPKFKTFISVIALSPMAIFISSSYNQDSVTYGLALVFVSWIVKLYNQDERSIKYKTIIIFTILSTALSILKFPYMLFCLLFLFIPKKIFYNRKINLMGKCSVIGVTFSLTILYFLNVSTKFVEFRIEGANSINQLKFIFANITYVIYIFIKAMFYHMGDYVAQLFTFGWLSYSPPLIIVYFYLTFLLIIGIFYTEDLNISTMNKVLIAVITVAIYGALHLILYMTWTPVGLNDIHGVQGRYLIPLFMLIPILKNNNMTIKYTDNTQINILIMANLFIASSFLTMIFRYY